MAAHDIPDLRTLLASRRGGASRARGRGGAASSTSSGPTLDSAVRNTDLDAAGARLSCVELGYLHDPYAQSLARETAARRLPLLNRGTYVRTAALDHLLDRFLTTSLSAPKQVLSLGAGSDTRYFRLLDSHPDVRLVYHELDFPANTSAKLASIQANPQLYGRLTTKTPPQPHAPAASYLSQSYNLHPIDLRALASNDDAETEGRLPNVDPNIPTLILSEMCLVYLQPATVAAIISKLITKYIPAPTPISLVLYEPILPNDAFGRTMIANLSTRHIHLPTLLAYPELADQRARLKSYGFGQGAKAADTAWLWLDWVSQQEKERVAGLEFLDELEELDLLLKHYCVTWGWRDGGEEGVFTRAWADVNEQGR